MTNGEIAVDGSHRLFDWTRANPDFGATIPALQRLIDTHVSIGAPSTEKRSLDNSRFIFVCAST